MHNGQILPLICDPAFCTEGGWHTTSVVVLGHRSVVVALHPEAQAHEDHLQAQALRFVPCARMSERQRKLQGGEGHYEHGAAFGGVECRYRAVEALYDFLHDG